jgi:Flp pilus assembly protein protease CpaA
MFLLVFVLVIMCGLQYLILRSGLYLLVRKIDNEIALEYKNWQLAVISVATAIECGLLIVGGNIKADISSVALLVIVLLLNLIGYIDAKTGNVYFVFSVPLLATCIFLNISKWDSFTTNIIPIVITALLCIISNKLGGMGTGDVEIFIALSIASGFRILFIIFFSLTFGGIGALSRMINRLAKKKKIRDILTGRQPLCPYIAIAYFACNMIISKL